MLFMLGPCLSIVSDSAFMFMLVRHHWARTWTGARDV